MLGPFRGLCFAAALLAAVSAGTGPARAEMTEADEAGMQAFTACLDEAGNDEDACIKKLGRYGWYPRDEEGCITIGARVEKVLEIGGIPKYSDLFKNERCARLGLPHGQKAAAAGIMGIGNERYTGCGLESISADYPGCESEAGQHLWYPRKKRDCLFPRIALEKDVGAVYFMQWFSLFETERCHRLGKEYFRQETDR